MSYYSIYQYTLILGSHNLLRNPHALDLSNSSEYFFVDSPRIVVYTEDLGSFC